MKKIENFMLYSGIVALGTFIGFKLYNNRKVVKDVIIEKDCSEIKPVRHYTKIKTIYKND